MRDLMKCAGEKPLCAERNTPPFLFAHRRLRASKIARQTCSSPEALALLLSIGFCPLVLPQSPPNTEPYALFLVLEAGDQAVARAKSVVTLLEAGINKQ